MPYFSSRVVYAKCGVTGIELSSWVRTTEHKSEKTACAAAEAKRAPSLSAQIAKFQALPSRQHLNPKL